MKDFFGKTIGGSILLFFIFTHFLSTPLGIFVGLTKHDAWDVLLSMTIPFYGFIAFLGYIL